MSILIRVVHHSSGAAYQIMKTPRLIDCICTDLLPLSWDRQADKEGSSVSTSQAEPLPSALRFIRILCLTGRNAAFKLVRSFDHFENKESKPAIFCLEKFLGQCCFYQYQYASEFNYHYEWELRAQ